METSTSKITRCFSAGGLRVVPIEGDGNCLFRAISHQLYGDESFHGSVRKEAVAHLRAHGDFYSEFCAGEGLEARVRRMSRDGEWGDHLELQALAEVHSASVEVYCDREFPIVVYAGGSDRTFRLYYKGLVHYDSLIEVEGVASERRSELKDSIDAHRKKLEKLNALVSRQNLKQSAGMSIKQIIERSLESLEKDFKGQTQAAITQSETTQIEEEILNQVINETKGAVGMPSQVGGTDNFAVLLSMGFSENAVIEAIINIGESEPSLEKYINFIYMNELN